MRRSRSVVVLILALLLATVGCTTHVTGMALPDPEKPPTAITRDGYGITAGFRDATVQIEIFTEPQCPRCAELQADFGDDLATYINTGQIAVTYRPLTFLDRRRGDYSSRVSNAMFLAVNPATEATDFQAFVQELWGSQSRRAPSDEDLAGMARQAGLPAETVERIGGGKETVDIVDMSQTNFGFLFSANPLGLGTPTVYDLDSGAVIDIYDDNWLTKLVASG